MSANSFRVVEDGKAWPIAELRHHDCEGAELEIAQRLGISVNEVEIVKIGEYADSITVEIACARVEDEPDDEEETP